MEGDNRSGWTPEMVKWNTIGTCAGAILGAASLLISIIILIRF